MQGPSTYSLQGDWWRAGGLIVLVFNGPKWLYAWQQRFSLVESPRASPELRKGLSVCGGENVSTRGFQG